MIVRSQETNLGDLAADSGIHALKAALGDDADSLFIVGLRNGGARRPQYRCDRRGRAKLPPIPNPDAGKPGAPSRSSTSRTRCASTTRGWCSTPTPPA